MQLNRFAMSMFLFVLKTCDVQNFIFSVSGKDCICQHGIKMVVIVTSSSLAVGFWSNPLLQCSPAPEHWKASLPSYLLYVPFLYLEFGLVTCLVGKFSFSLIEVRPKLFFKDRGS